MESQGKTKVVLVTGATGFIGSHLIDSLLADGHDVWGVSRSPSKLKKRWGKGVRALDSLQQVPESQPIDVIFNLAGAPILDRRWSEARKQELYDSRLKTTEAVLGLIERLSGPAPTLISGSAVGFYGSQVDDLKRGEGAQPSHCFAHKLCHDWEQKALQAENLGARVCLSRTGIVLGGDGGALKRMLLPFKLGLGGPIGSGKQWFSWIHIDDMVAVLRFLMERETLAGAFNATAPEPVTNEVFTRELAARLKRPALFRVPAPVLNLLLGEGAELLVEGQRVVPARLEEAGFEFRYRTLERALAAAVKGG
ncbi:TIGR01777 family oxidoreductase [Motiliproteus sp. SC1-56]|uniref:TIGR01777 family oxidoreductase n=1 Tax=Motiliproteus sp. SC1-56 TaxID=2799565 RepID=UPI001A8DF87C|nr:TIGR01777 family oxidoreductase [Motiliproteus sp. SC1-56]